MMEMSVNAEVLASDVASSSLDTAEEEGEAAAPPAACKSSSSSDVFDAMAEFGSRLKDIIGTHGSAAGLLDRQSAIEAEVEEMKKESKADMVVSTETDVSLILQSLKVFSSPQDKLDDLVKKHAQLAACRRCDEQKRLVLQQRLTDLLDETRSSVSARGKLEGLCRELQGHYDLLREETLLRCKEDEEKRSEIASHFQTKLTEIQVQIEQHSVRNDKLCHENINLTDKLESLMGQCELREESLEKINQRRDLQQKLTEAKLQQAEALLTEAVEKHQREKEYLLREAIDKTKKCFAMKEQELSMKKKLTLYAQKFDEFQATLAKSNEIYARFKKEMDNMSDKMKKMEKESNLWKTRFENCNKALANMIEERTEKSKEYELFVMKIQKLEKLCRVLQEERVVLYNKIKEVRISNANIQAKVLEGSNPDDVPVTDGAEKSDPLTPTELQEIQEEDPVLTEDMSRLKEEQKKLQEFATSLFAIPVDDEEDHHESDPEEDLVASAFDQFQTKTEVKDEAVPVPETVVEVMPEDPVLSLEPMSPTEGSALPEPTPEDETPGAVKAETQVEEERVQPEKSDEDLQQKPSEPQPENVKISPPSELKPEAAEAEILAGEIEPVEQGKVQALQVPEEAPTKSESAPPSETSPKTIAPSNSNSSKKQTPKKKKKKNTNKNAS